jgi:hypothetical protein
MGARMRFSRWFKDNWPLLLMALGGFFLILGLFSGLVDLSY